MVLGRLLIGTADGSLVCIVGDVDSVTVGLEPEDAAEALADNVEDYVDDGSISEGGGTGSSRSSSRLSIRFRTTTARRRPESSVRSSAR